MGLNNNLKFLKRCISNDTFKEGEYDTNFIQENIDTLLHRPKEIDMFDLVTAIVCHNVSQSVAVNLPSDLLNYRNVKSLKHKQVVSLKDTSLEGAFEWAVSVERTDSKKGSVEVEGKKYEY